MAEQKQIGNLKVIICQSKQEANQEGANIFAKDIKENPDIVLGLATGGTPVGMYQELIRMYEREEVDFSRINSFNLDEYVGLSGDHFQSYRYFMNDNLFNRINIDKANTHVPDGKAEDIPASCREYEEAIRAHGGVDLQLVGIGSNGHIAFNEPGSALDSRTREVSLTEETIKDNARFFEDEAEVPKKAVTMGIATILEAKKIVLLVTGKNKAEAVNKAIKGLANPDVPASFLQSHPNCIFILDKEAASGLGRCQNFYEKKGNNTKFTYKVEP